jgi:mono/diheme cytochrome c family protein
MHQRRHFPLFLLLALTAAHHAAGADPAALWSAKVQPLFDLQCVKCHGPIEQHGGLELDTPAAVLTGGDDGAVVVPGQPEASRLFQNLAVEADQHMPPEKQLTDAEREVVREWITALAAAPSEPTVEVTVQPTARRKFASVTEAIDGFIAEGWARRGVQPAAPVDDRAWCRRVYLDLAGRIPTAAEWNEFLVLPEDTRRSALVDRLLVSDDYAVRMRELWDVFLMGRGKREAHEDRRRQNGWWAYLENAFRNNRPWDETVRELLIARPDSPEAKGASWFLYERRNNHQAIAEAVAPVVYGTRIDCAQCHDHPLAREIKQAHYWGLVAAFNRGKNVEGTAVVAESAVGGFVNFTNLKKESQPALITLLNGRTVPENWPAGDQKEEDSDDKYVDPAASPRVPKFSRREAFAEAATRDNPLLARGFVNRLWAVLFGRGIVSPVDEMNARNTPSYPELLDWLADDFATHGYDIRRLVRGIVLSQVYALGPAVGTVPPDAFAGARERPLTAEQLARSWRIAAGLTSDDQSLRRATIAALPDVLPQEYNATFQQAQFLSNAPVLQEVLRPVPESTAASLTALPDTTARVREAFLAVYGRSPDAQEAAQAAALLEARSGDPAGGVRDLLWALLTSAEFLTAP